MHSSPGACLKGTTAAVHELIAATWDAHAELPSLLICQQKWEIKSQIPLSCRQKIQYFKTHRATVYSQLVACGLVGAHTMR